MSLNIDRLHHCVDKLYAGKQLVRGEGRTTALIQILRGVTWFAKYDEYTQIAVIVPHNKVMDHTLINICHALSEDWDNITVHRSSGSININNNINIKCVSFESFTKRSTMRGIRLNYLFVDMNVSRISGLSEFHYLVSSAMSHGAIVYGI